MKREKLFLSTIDSKAGAAARELGVGIEIADYCTAMNMDMLLSETKPKVDAQVRNVFNRIFHGPFNELFPCAIDPLARDLAAKRYLQAVQMSMVYGAKRLVFHGGYVPHVYYPCWYTEQSILFWKDFLKKIPENVTLYIENVMESDPQWMADIAAGVDDPRFRLCLDVGHANAELSLTPVEEWVERCRPWLSHLHLHNNAGGWDLHDPLERGTVPMEEVLELLSGDTSLTYTLETLEAGENVTWLLEKGFLKL